MDGKRATLRDVAAAAGVSRALAGFVLGDDHGKSIPEASRQRVRDAARGLGYVPTSSGATPSSPTPTPAGRPELSSA